MVPSNIIPSHSGTGDQTSGAKPLSDTQTIHNASSEQAIRDIGYQGNNETIVKILNASLRESTRTKCSIYSTYIRQWESFIGTTRDIAIEHVLNFLSNLQDKGISYSAFVIAKCALGSRVTVAPYQSLNDHLLIIKFITGVHNLKPPAPKLSFIWDVSIIFQYFENCGHIGDLSDKILTQKLALFLLPLRFVPKEYKPCLHSS